MNSQGAEKRNGAPERALQLAAFVHDAAASAEAPLEKYEIRVEGGAVNLPAAEALQVAERFAYVQPDTLDRVGSLSRALTTRHLAAAGAS